MGNERAWIHLHSQGTQHPLYPLVKRRQGLTQTTAEPEQAVFEAADPIQLQTERGKPELLERAVQRRHSLLGQGAHKGQGQVKLLRRGPVQRAQGGLALCDPLLQPRRKFQGNEQARRQGPIGILFHHDPKSGPERSNMQILLAPMEGVVDSTLRALLSEIGGIDQCVTEFVRVCDRLLPPGVFYRLAPELRQGGRTSAGTRVVVQLLGSDPSALADNAARAVELGAPGIDLNFGCPAKTVNRSRGGAILLQEPETLFNILTAVRAALPLGIPLSAKMRLGYNDTALALENAQAIAQAGVNSLVVHARTRAEGYRPPAHWEWIARIREAVSVPVIANGEVWTPADYHRCRQVSGCADVMIGRGLVANPFLGLVIKGQAVEERCGWPGVLPLLIRFHGEVMSTLPPGHSQGRLKQWLNMLGWQFPEARALFMALRRERDPQLLHRGLLQARDQLDASSSVTG